MQGYGNRGMEFERMIENANKQYRMLHTAVIEKQHTLCKPIRDRNGKVINAKYDEKATVDFMGRSGNVPVAFEAKQCTGGKIALNRVQPHQLQFLIDWTSGDGAIGFVFVSYGMERFYIIPFDYWMAAVMAREGEMQRGAVSYEPIGTEFKLTGKASIKESEMPGEWKVQPGRSVWFDYLETVRRLWKLKQ